jgi:hypothetical protein
MEHAAMSATPSSTARRLARALAAVGRLLAAGCRAMAGPVYFPDEARGMRLIDCPACGKPFVCAVAWNAAGASHRSMRLRCGNCEATRELLVTHAEAAAFEQAGRAHTAAIARAATQLDRERMAAELDAFVAALRDGRIDASSFGRWA